MNDFERKLRDTPLRTPPREWRGEIPGALPANQPAALNWRAWLWPAPPAWLALAAVWLALFTIESISSHTTAPPARATLGKVPPADSLFASRHEQMLLLMR